MNVSYVKWLGPSRIPESDMQLLYEILMIVAYKDPLYTISLCKTEERLIAHITPSCSEFRQATIDSLLWINKNLKVKIQFSSSLKISKLISFTIDLQMPEVVTNFTD